MVFPWLAIYWNMQEFPSVLLLFSYYSCFSIKRTFHHNSGTIPDWWSYMVGIWNCILYVSWIDTCHQYSIGIHFTLPASWRKARGWNAAWNNSIIICECMHSWIFACTHFNHRNHSVCRSWNLYYVCRNSDDSPLLHEHRSPLQAMQSGIQLIRNHALKPFAFSLFVFIVASICITAIEYVMDFAITPLHVQLGRLSFMVIACLRMLGIGMIFAFGTILYIEITRNKALIHGDALIN